jgi:hydrogenase expression/formation protein HypC
MRWPCVDPQGVRERASQAASGRERPARPARDMQTVRTMCLGVPGRVVSIDGNVATVDFWGLMKPVRLDVVDTPVVPGDYILNHVGFAIRRIPPGEVEGTLALYDELLRGGGADDLMAADVRGELDAAGARGG